MTIQRNLILVVGAVLLLNIFSGALLYRQQVDLNLNLQRNLLVSELIQDEVRMQTLVGNYIWSQDEQFIQQYLGLMARLQQNLKRAEGLFQSGSRKRLIEFLLRESGALEALLERLRSNVRARSAVENSPANESLHRRLSDQLVSQLLIRYQYLVGETLRLHNQEERGSTKMVQENLRWMIFALASVLLLIAAISFALIHRIRRDFGRLAGGVKRLGEGNLSTRVVIDGAGEIARLGHIFNQMTGRLEQGEARQSEIMDSLRQEQQRVLQKAQQEEVLSLLGQIALKRQPMQGYLEEMLGALLHSVSWLCLQTKGAVFLSDRDGEQQVLKMAVSLNMPGRLVSRCAQVAIGECLCGRAAATQEVVHAAHVDGRHEIGLPEMDDHGHYCLPIMQENHLLGVLTLYLSGGHEMARDEVQFLKQVSDIFGLGIVQRQSEERIAFQAYHDALTGLANRRRLQERMRRELAVARRTGQYGALLFFDLDNFKVLNDSLGHDVGDELLVQVANRLRQTARAGDMLVRVGGDEFLLVLSALSDDMDAALLRAGSVADKLKQVITRPYHLHGHEYHLTASFGITLFPDGEATGEELFRRADTAMYKAKTEGRNGIAVFSREMQEQADRRLFLEQDMRAAIAQGEFQAWFQPKFSGGGEVLGAEVLLRWNHHEQGWLSPAEFIPIAEESGLIVELGYWLLDEICRLLPGWAERLGQAMPDHIAINISPNQFYQPGLVKKIEQVVQVCRAVSIRLILEVTEGVLLQKSDQVIDTMGQLKALGVQLSIDDFGTGYSSLAYLKRLPLDEIKIDRSFVEGVHRDEDNRLIVDTILGMARHFRLGVVAEGVETRADLDFLMQRGCQVFQGFLFSRPLPEQRFLELLEQRWMQERETGVPGR